MSWYRTGTVTVTNGSTVVIGSGTAFVASARVGDAFIGPNGAIHEITNIASDTALSIYPAYVSATLVGNYTIGPIQGYDKLLADKAGQILQEWGSTLAGLGDAASQDVVPVAMGGTGGTTAPAARAGLGLKTAAVADVVGAVAAGAIIEQGNNTNGAYTKFADGTLECWYTARVSKTLNQFGPALFFGAIEPAKAFPVVFASLPAISLTASGEFECFIAPTGLGGVSQWPAVYLASIVARNAATFDISYIAKGRWK